MTVAELRTLLTSLDDELPIHVDMYDGEYLLTHGRAESASVAKSALRLKAAKYYGEKDDWDQICDRMEANPWKGEPTHCSHPIVRKKVPGFCLREVRYGHDGKPWCDRHYPPTVEYHRRIDREHDEFLESLEKQRKAEEAELSELPGAMDYLPSPDTTFSVQVPETSHYLPSLVSVSWERPGSWVVVATCDLTDRGTSKTDWTFRLTIDSLGPHIDILASVWYHRKSNRGPWKEGSRELLVANREVKNRLRRAAEMVLFRQIDIEYEHDRKRKAEHHLQSLMNQGSLGRPQ